MDRPAFQIDPLQHVRDELLAAEHEMHRARLRKQTLGMAAQHMQILEQTVSDLEARNKDLAQQIEQLKAALAAEKQDGNP